MSTPHEHSAAGRAGPGGSPALERLRWSLRGRPADVGPRVVLRLRSSAANRLGMLGLDLHDPADRPAVQTLLGARAWATLHPRSVRGPSMADVQHTWARLEVLEEHPPARVRTARRPQPRPRVDGGRPGAAR
jgi:hypothetical protein